MESLEASSHPNRSYLKNLIDHLRQDFHNSQILDIYNQERDPFYQVISTQLPQIQNMWVSMPNLYDLHQAEWPISSANVW